MESLVGQRLLTPGRQEPNWILGSDGTDVKVATEGNRARRRVPISLVQNAVDRIYDGETFVIDRRNNSAFLGAVLATKGQVELLLTDPWRARLAPAAARSNPDWEFDELVLALDLYLRWRPKQPPTGHPDLQELSGLLQRLPIHPPETRREDFRNPNGVRRKLGDFTAPDPDYAGAPTKGGAGVHLVWERFANDPQALAEEVARITATANGETRSLPSEHEEGGSARRENAPARWWNDDPAEVFWLETTDRTDLGVDLNAPVQTEEGAEYWSYAFVPEVRDGDIVLHYRPGPKGAITHWSRAVGEAYADEVFWGAHGQASGRGRVDPYFRPGWRHPLDGPYPLERSVTLDHLRGLEPQLRTVLEGLQREHPGISLDFPFQFSDTRPVRAFQGYLTKFPRALVSVVPGLRGGCHGRDGDETDAPGTNAWRCGERARDRLPTGERRSADSEASAVRGRSGPCGPCAAERRANPGCSCRGSAGRRHGASVPDPLRAELRPRLGPRRDGRRRRGSGA